MCAFLFYAVLLHFTSSIAEKISNLPGQPPVTFDQYSGYIVLNKTTNKSLFYWFQESQSSPSTDPVALWTNGGPGCSGLLGAFTEQGAFRIEKNLSLTINPGSWNKVANMLYVEQPIGVGFSYSDDDRDYVSGDESAAKDMFDMISGFLDQFPKYKTNDFYITAESYGGHYMPTTAKYIVDNDKNNEINFKGFFVGNPFTNPIENRVGSYGTFFGHQLLPRPLWLKWEKNCLGLDNVNEQCPEWELEMMLKVGDVYHYGVDWPVCDPRYIQQQWFMQKIINQTLKRPIPNWFKDDITNRRKLQFDPCALNYLTTYLNRADVQSALHTRPDSRWRQCGGTLYNYADSLIPMEKNYEYLCKGNYDLKMTIYSGDDDTVCGTMGTQYWMNNMTSWNITADGYWKAWDLNNQTGGYQTKWKCGNKQNISLVTVHSAGHEVPWYKQSKGLWVFDQFLKGNFA